MVDNLSTSKQTETLEAQAQDLERALGAVRQRIQQLKVKKEEQT